MRTSTWSLAFDAVPFSASFALANARISIFSSLPVCAIPAQRSPRSRSTCITCSTQTATRLSRSAPGPAEAGPAGFAAAGEGVSAEPTSTRMCSSLISIGTGSPLSRSVRSLHREVAVRQLQRLDHEGALHRVEVAHTPLLGDGVGHLPGAQLLALLVQQDHVHVVGPELPVAERGEEPPDDRVGRRYAGADQHPALQDQVGVLRPDRQLVDEAVLPALLVLLRVVLHREPGHRLEPDV